MRILITGSRDWDDWRLLQAAIRAWAEKSKGSVTIIHGGARGADTLAGKMAQDNDWDEEIYVADWDAYGKKAGSIRNQKMVDSGADVCLAFPLPQSRGTYDCIRRAKAAGIHVAEYKAVDRVSKPHMVFFSTKELPMPGFWIVIVRLNRYAAYLWTEGAAFCPGDRMWSYLPDGRCMAGLPLPEDGATLDDDWEKRPNAAQGGTH